MTKQQKCFGNNASKLFFFYSDEKVVFHNYLKDVLQDGEAAFH